MTPKEKAKDLVDKFLTKVDHNDAYWGIDEVAKECAIIAVDEIINTVIGNDWSSPILSYWEEVKEELGNI
jgi:hypothetical protein